MGARIQNKDYGHPKAMFSQSSCEDLTQIIQNESWNWEDRNSGSLGEMPSILQWLETAPRRGEQTVKPGWEARGGDQEWELMPVAKKIHLPATERGSCITAIHPNSS